MLKWFFILSIAFLMVFSIALLWMWRPVSAIHPALKSSNLPASIPLRDLYANQDSKYGWALSADGDKLTWLEIEWFKPILRIKNLKTGKVSSVRPPKGFLAYAWAADQKTILFTLDAKGYEYQKIAAIDATNPNSGMKIFDLGEKTTAFVFYIPKHKTDEIIIAHNGRDPSSFDTYRLNVKTGGTEPFGARLGHQTSYALDHTGNIFGRVVHTAAQSGDWSFEVPVDDEGWKQIARGDYKDRLVFSNQVGKDGHVYALSNRQRDKTSLVKFNLEDGSETLVHSDPDVDLSGVLLNPETNELLMAISYPGHQRRVFFDKEFEEDVASLNMPEGASFHLVSQSHDFSKSLIQIETADAGFETWLIDREKGKTEAISKANISKHRGKLSPIEPVFIKARDGLGIPAFLSRPKGVTDAAPLVILIHGGPVDQASWGYETFRSLLNNRGYAVLDVNYRGSSGYGRRFMEAAKGEISAKMSSDIIDAREWAVKQGIADPEKVALYGVSWGGFEVLTALTQHSDLFAAGVSINGVADLSTILNEVPDYWRGWQEWLIEFGADPNTEEGRQALLEKSPLTRASSMTTPLLLIQAANDVRVVQGQSDRMVKLLNDVGAPVEYHLVQGVGHSPGTWPWQKQYLDVYRIEHFLAKHLGGRTGNYDYALIGAYVFP